MEYTKKMTWAQLKKYQFVMGDLSHEYFAAYMMGQKSFNVGLGLIKIWDEKLTEQKRKDKALSDTAKNNNKGIEYEKDGNIKAAIRVYKKNLEIGYPATYSYDRLMIIYRKEKKIDEEIAVIDRALEIFASDPRYEKNIVKWNDRRDKAVSLKTKL